MDFEAWKAQRVARHGSHVNEDVEGVLAALQALENQVSAVYIQITGGRVTSAYAPGQIVESYVDDAANEAVRVALQDLLQDGVGTQAEESVELDFEALGQHLGGTDVSR